MDDLRKVQRMGSGSFFICIPRSWACKHGLRKGMVVALNEIEDGKLFIDPRLNAELTPRSVSLTAGPCLSREIVSTYRHGFAIIRINADDRIDPNLRKIIKATVGSLIGLEIIEESYSQIVLQYLLEPSYFPPEKILRRNYAIVAGMYRDAVNSFVNSNLKMAKRVIARDGERNRLYFLLVRILHMIIQTSSLGEKLKITPTDCLDYHLAASLVKAMGNTSAQIATKTLELSGVKLSENLRKLLVNSQWICYDAHGQALRAFVNKDSTLAENIRSVRSKIMTMLKDIGNATKDQPPEVTPHILAVASFLMQIYEKSVDLADLVV